MKNLIVALLLFTASFGVAHAAKDTDDPVTIKDHTAGMEKHDGFFTYYWDAEAGQIWLEIENFGDEFLYVSYLSRGLGSNDIGLDRGQISGTSVVYFRRVGPKVLMMQKNYDFRTSSGDTDQQNAVDESFAQSTLWGFTITAAEHGRVLVDATDFILRDARDVIGSLKRNGQGRFSIAASRSTVEPERTRNFPLNTEFEALLTYTADTAGYFVRQVAPTPTAFTIGQHHSLVQLPDADFQTRRGDPRCGYFGIDYVDHGAPLSESNRKHFIMRHRLTKTNPGPAPSTVTDPIVYYVDRGTPEPMRSALVEGASWWNEAFEAAGFIDAFRVELMPEDADPLDVRYNTIQWVHRATRGWSYGGAVADPRTGEAIKGHVTLGSLRARQDYLIAEGILGPYGDGATPEPRMRELALARLRQLSCHEVGHTLGLRHNFAASTINRASVMDYPYPYITLGADGAIDLSDAYDIGVGAWDKAAITYGYQEFALGADEDSASAAFLDQMYTTGLVFASDADARSTGSAHPLAHLWDNGANAIDELDRLMIVRAQMLKQFSERMLKDGTPMVVLEETLVPIYMYHRYQLQAVPKFIGGIDYRFAVRGGSGDQESRPVNGAEQRRALRALLAAIEPDALMLNDAILKLLPPQTVGYVRSRELFSRRSGDVFDLYSAAESVADIPIRYLLHPHRAARLEAQYADDDDLPSLGEVLDQLIDATWKAKRQQGRAGMLQLTVDNLVLHHLILLANTKSTSVSVQATAHGKLFALARWLTNKGSQVDEQIQAHFHFASRQIRRFLETPHEFESYRPVRTPAGSPIGNDWSQCGGNLETLR